MATPSAVRSQLNSSSGTTVVATIGTAPTVGNLLVVFVWPPNPTGPKTGWSSLATATASGGPVSMNAYYRVAQSGDGTSYNVATLASSTSYNAFYMEIQNQASTWSYQNTTAVSNTGTGGTTEANLGTIVTSRPNMFWLTAAVCLLETSLNTAPSGWTQTQAASNAWLGKIQAGTYGTSLTPSVVFNTTSGNAYSAAIAVGIAGVASWSSSPSETLTPSDSSTDVQALNQSISDIITPSDSAADAAGTRMRSGVETINPSDASSETQSLNRSLADTISSSDAVNALKVTLRNAMETISASDLIARTVSLHASVMESISINDVVTRTLALHQTRTELLSLSDAVLSIAAHVLSILDALTPIDAVNMAQSLHRSPADTQTIADTVMRAVSKMRTVMESISVLDGITRIQSLHQSANDVQSLSESVHLRYVKILSDAISLLESINYYVNLRGRPIAITVGLTMTQPVVLALTQTQPVPLALTGTIPIPVIINT